MSNVDVLIDEQIRNKVTLCGKDFYIKKLGIIRECRLLKLVSGSIATQSKILKEKFKEGQSYQDDIMSLFGMLDENILPDILAIILDIDDIDFCKKAVEEEDEKILDIILLILEVNNIPNLIKKAQRVFEKISSLM